MQRVWVELGAESTRSHGPTLRMRLLAPTHPLVLTAVAEKGTSPVKPASKSRAISRPYNPPQPVGNRPTSAGQATGIADERGEALTREVEPIGVGMAPIVVTGGSARRADPVSVAEALRDITERLNCETDAAASLGLVQPDGELVQLVESTADGDASLRTWKLQVGS